MYHPKFSILSASAICLWDEVKNFCDKWHTNGLLPKHEMKLRRFYAPKFLAELVQSAGKRPDGTAYAPLLEATGDGYQMHDYLNYNQTREQALLGEADANDRAELRQAANRKRQAESRARRKVELEALRNANSNAESPLRTQTASGPIVVAVAVVPERAKNVSAEQKPHPVARFLELYESLFEQAHGVKPLIVTGRDPGIAKQLITKLGESDARALLQAFFASDDPFIQEAGHGLNIFAGQANKLLSSRKLRKPGAPVEDWREAWGYCFHTPTCTDSDACRVKRASERELVSH